MSGRDLEFGISCLHFEWQTIEEAFARVQDEFALASVEMSTNRLDPPDYPTCKRIAAERAVGVDLHAWQNLASQPASAGIEAMEANLHICAAIAAAHLVVHFGSNPSRDQGIEIVCDICRAVAPAYEAAGVTICLENHYRFEYEGKNEIGGVPEDFLEVFDAVRSPAVKFCLDYGHSHMGKNTGDFIDQLAPHLAYTHIADNMGEHDDHLAYGEGTVDWEREIGHTLRMGFRGPFVIEFPEWRCGAVRFGEFVELVKRLARG